jgi:low affinity Fe/Cu permease
MSKCGGMTWLRHHFTSLGTYASQPIAFFIVLAFGALWFVIEPDTLNWHGIATLATLLMTFFIQRSTHRDTQAIHARLDELLRSDPEDRPGLAGIASAAGLALAGAAFIVNRQAVNRNSYGRALGTANAVARHGPRRPRQRC